MQELTTRRASTQTTTSGIFSFRASMNLRKSAGETVRELLKIEIIAWAIEVGGHRA